MAIKLLTLIYIKIWQAGQIKMLPVFVSKILLEPGRFIYILSMSVFMVEWQS